MKNTNEQEFNATVRFTTAPEAFDYNQVLERNATAYRDHRGRQWHEVIIATDEQHRVDAQILRYESGLHPALTFEEWVDELGADGGLVIFDKALH